jgi:hypothetical protein
MDNETAKMEVDRLTAEIAERIVLRDKLISSLADSSAINSDDSAVLEAKVKLEQCTREIGERLKRLDELGVKIPEWKG